MRTNIEIDETLLAEAMTATSLRTKRKVVEAGLRLLARHKQEANARELVRSYPMGWRSASRAPGRADEPDRSA